MPTPDSQEGGAPALRGGSARAEPLRAALPLELGLLGRTLLHAAAVGTVAGLFGVGFLFALERTQSFLLEGLAGYEPLRAAGEGAVRAAAGRSFHPFLLVLIPAAGGLASGVLSRLFAPETAGGGGDAVIEAYHHGGAIRPRVLLVKPLTAVLALGSGGSGGREGPTMHIGGAIGAWVGRLVPASASERRILVAAGIAAGISAVFRTPLGAALLAVEMLYRDDFESDALIPAILASVVAYAVALVLLGPAKLFGHLPHSELVPAHLPLFVLLGVVVAAAGAGFVAVLRAVQRWSGRSPLPSWARPGLGGLLMGALGTAVALLMRRWYGGEAVGLGVFGGGYGAAQVALTGLRGLQPGWALVGLLLLLAAGKAVATALTVGSGASAGDFAPSVVMGALVGGAFGVAASLLIHDPRVSPTAFALVGMGTFYGALANTPLAAVVLVCELAGSYDLLVPMMLATGVGYVALKNVLLYPAQPASRSDTPAFRAQAEHLARVLQGEGLLACHVLRRPELAQVEPRTPLRALLAAASAGARQQVLVVAHPERGPAGLVDLKRLRELPFEDLDWMLAADVMVPFLAVGPGDGLPRVARLLLSSELPELPVVGEGGVEGFVGWPDLAPAAETGGAAPG